MTALVAPLEIVRNTPKNARSPEFDHARELQTAVRIGVGELLGTYCEYAGEILRLRAFCLKDKSRNLLVGPNAQLVRSGDGFIATLERELGLHHEEAKRLLDRAEYITRLRLVAGGDAVKYITGTGSERHEETFLPDEEAQVRADRLLVDVVAGDVKPSAAWAGLVGEARRVAETGKKERLEPDHLGLLVKAAATIRRIGPHWDRLLRPGAKARAIDELGTALAALPPHVFDAIVSAAGAGEARRK